MTLDSSVPPRDGSVFISYARADNEKPPHDDRIAGWVTFFWDQLRWELTTRGAKRAKLWLDRYEIDPAEAFTAKIEAAVKEAAVMVPIFSENWVQSEWCRAEVEGFARNHQDAGQRVVPIFKTELDRKLLPSIIQSENAKEGYKFYEVNSRGELHEFYWRGLKDIENYFLRLRDVALFIIAQMDRGNPIPVVQKPRSGRTAFVAQSTSELRDARQRLMNDLIGAGHSVVPDIDSLPDIAADYEAAIRVSLEHSELAVFLLAEQHGMTPSGGTELILDLQIRIAREVAAGGRNFSRVLWAPKWLPGLNDQKRDPFEVVARFGGLQPGEELFAEEVTNLSQWLRERMVPLSVLRDAEAGPILIIAADKADEDAVFDLANLLQGLDRRILPLESDAALPSPEGTSTPSAVVIWGNAESAVIDSCLARLPKNWQMICLLLPGGDERAKRRFFREAVLSEKLPSLPTDRKGARALLERLELLPEGQEP